MKALAGVPAGLLAGGLSGALCFAAFPPADLWVLAPVALVPLAAQFRVAGGRGPVIAGAVSFGLVFNGFLLYWIRLFGIVPYIALTLVQTLWITAALLAGFALRKRLPESLRFLAFPLLFFLQEYARSHVPWGGFAWGGMGYTQHDNLPVLKLAAYTGVWGISLILLLINSMLAEIAVWGRSGLPRARRFGAAIALMGILPLALPVPAPSGPRAELAMIQPSVPENTLDPNADDDVVLAAIVRLTAELQETPDLIVWPEGAFDRDPFGTPRFEAAMKSSARQAGTHLMVGALLGDRRDGVRNSTLMLDEDGEVVQTYTKQRLVPFGEWAPLRSLLQPLVPDLERIAVDQTSGSESTVFEIPRGAVASVICYESTYPSLVRSFVRNGARLLVVSANFSSFDRSSASAQHIAFSQLRAAEQRMWVAHSSLSGISAVVDPEGRVLERTSLFEPAVLTPSVRFAQTITPYARLGDWLPAAVLLATAALAALASAGRHREPPA